MAQLEYESLATKYMNFKHPEVMVKVGGKNIVESKSNLAISDVEVEMTSGFEAAMATFWIYNSYSMTRSMFLTEDLKPYITLGTTVEIYMGYSGTVREVFKGFIAKVNFSFQREEIPGVEVTAMDIKGIMMANNYSKQLKESYYHVAVKKILEEEYSSLKSAGIVEEIRVSATPDDPAASSTQSGGVGTGAGMGGMGNAEDSGTTDRTIEMVCESDYEFVVKVAKRYNFEFFSIGGDVYFRPAKENKEELIELGAATGMRNMSVEYDMTGLVSKVEVRSVDVGKGKLVTSSQKINNKISQSSKAKQLLKSSKKVYIDPTVTSKEEAGYRANYLVEDMSYRYGTFEAELIGLPDLIPGRFVRLVSLGTSVENLFYLTSVRHVMAEDGYLTYLTGKAAKLDDGSGAAGLAGSMPGF